MVSVTRQFNQDSFVIKANVSSQLTLSNIIRTNKQQDICNKSSWVKVKTMIFTHLLLLLILFYYFFREKVVIITISKLRPISNEKFKYSRIFFKRKTTTIFANPKFEKKILFQKNFLACKMIDLLMLFYFITLW